MTWSGPDRGTVPGRGLVPPTPGIHGVRGGREFSGVWAPFRHVWERMRTLQSDTRE